MRLLDQLGDAFVVAGLGVGDVVGQGHLVLDIDQQVQLVAEPLDDLGDLAVVVLVLLACRRWAAASPCSTSAACSFSLTAARPARPVESPAVSRPRSPTTRPEAPDHDIEDAAEMRQVRLLAERRQEARHVVGVGDVVFGFDADEQPQGRIASEFFEAGIGGDVPQGDGQERGCPRGPRRDSRRALCRVRRGATRAGRDRGWLRGGRGGIASEGESSRASQANRGLVMAIFMGACGAGGRAGTRPLYTTQQIPAGSGRWSRNRGKRGREPLHRRNSSIPRGIAFLPRCFATENDAAAALRNGLSEASFHWSVHPPAWYSYGMATDLTQKPAPRVVDLTGLPEPVVQKVTELVEAARQKQAEEAAAAGGRQSVIGMFEHLGIKTPTLEEFEEARRETWANFPRDFPDPAK